MKKRLSKEVQCAKCPWKRSVNPDSIPNGYSRILHRKLKRTIAKEGECSFGEIPAMACHESKVGEEDYCLGWLMNQIGQGNNIPLRFKMLDYDLTKVQLIGEQHEWFEGTLPNATI